MMPTKKHYENLAKPAIPFQGENLEKKPFTTVNLLACHRKARSNNA